MQRKRIVNPSFPIFKTVFLAASQNKFPMQYFHPSRGMSLLSPWTEPWPPTPITSMSAVTSMRGTKGKRILPSPFLQLFFWPHLTTDFQLKSFVPPPECHLLSPWTEHWPPTPFISTPAVTAMCHAKKEDSKSVLPHFYNCFPGSLSQQISN
jgi:hypothetical protein